ncbi:MAG: T9SS type A sorting domain-containing protein, partial [Saprospiraceae bacterium]|nr:T9SS type A sorting domain-containing protein [Saprospiraceae bacterium]
FHTVYVTAYDSCYNSNVDSIVVHVQDKVAPIAVCDQNTVVALDDDGIVHTYADIFDDGSFDDCQIKKIEVRRMDDPCMSGTDEWGDYVEFCCADVNREVMVAFRVADKSGNYGTCMVRVLVQDKLPPRVKCPPNITVDCRFDYDPNNLDVFGKMVHFDSLREPIVIDSDTVRFDGPAIDGLAYDNCPMVMVDTSWFERFDQCGNGRLYRDFYAVDAQGQRSFMCRQHITFVNSRPFTERDIIWPVDFDTVNVCTTFPFDPDFLSEERAYPRFRIDDECSLLGATYKDHVIDNTGGAEGCFKILRKWKVIDWCQNYNNEFETWEHEQVIIVENNRPPAISSRTCQDTVICFFTPNCIPPEITLSIAAIDDCTPRDQLFIKAKIDFDNDGSFDTTRLDGNSVTDQFPAGIHRIKWFVEDLCGNETTCEHLFELRNCKAPLAYCRTGAILELVPWDTTGDGNPDTEKVILWAKDLDDGSSTACGTGLVFSFSADTTERSRVYDCDSIGDRMVTIYVTDRQTGVSSRCRTMVTIQDNNNVSVCPQTLTGNISGLIHTPDTEMMEDVAVELEGSGMPADLTENGIYEFNGMPFGGHYVLKPGKNDDPMNGVSTSDIVKLHRYLLGKTTLNGPYEYIAADVNMSSTITAADISEIRKLILGSTSEFASGKSWRFVDETYTFNDPDDPLSEQFTEIVRFEPFQDDQTVNWVGVKLGDLNGDAAPGVDQDLSTRSGYVLSAAEQFTPADEFVEVIIRNTDLAELEACQFTFEIDLERAEIVEVSPLRDDMGGGNFNLDLLHMGIFTFSWDNPDREQVNDLIKVRLLSKQDAFVSEMITLTNEVTRSLASDGGDERPVQLSFMESSDMQSEIELYQNVPNPWSDWTVVRFKLPTDQKVSLTIVDANGREVWRKDGMMDEGMNTVRIEKGSLMSSGVLYYQLKTEDQVLTRKMLVL